MRLVFLGTSELAATALRALSESDHEVLLVVTQPDRGAGRGRKPKPSPVKVAANALGLELIQPESVNTRAFRAIIKDQHPEVLVVAAFGQILRPLLLAIPPLGCLNIHASILPRHRGASPINAAILAGDDEVGVSIMKMDEGMDTGPVGLVGRMPATPTETAGELHDRLATLGGELIVEALALLAEGKLEFTPQNDAKATHAHKLAKSDGLIRLDCDASETLRRIRGLSPWPGCFADLVTGNDTRRINIGDAQALTESFGSASPGEIVDVSSEGIVVACARGALRISTVKPAGKRMMPVSDFLNGTHVEVGDRLIGAPLE